MIGSPRRRQDLSGLGGQTEVGLLLVQLWSPLFDPLLPFPTLGTCLI